MAGELTEATRYQCEIGLEGDITATEFRMVMKDGEFYVKEAICTCTYYPGMDPDSLPGSMPELARVVWTADVVEAYERANPVEEDPLDPVDPVDEPVTEEV